MEETKKRSLCNDKLYHLPIPNWTKFVFPSPWIPGFGFGAFILWFGLGFFHSASALSALSVRNRRCQ
jgi:hypothetical protein